MIIYGLHGFNHGGAKALAADADIITNAGARRLVDYLLPGKARRRACAPIEAGLPAWRPPPSRRVSGRRRTRSEPSGRQNLLD